MENCSKSNCPAQHKAEVFTPANQVAYAEGAVVSRTIIENGGGNGDALFLRRKSGAQRTYRTIRCNGLHP